MSQELDWTPIREGLPIRNTTDLGEEYLVMLGHPYYKVCPMNFRDGRWFSGGWGTSITYWDTYVTHYMYLPAPDEEAQWPTLTE